MTNEKQLYLCLIASLHQPGESPEYRFMTAPIASSEQEAKQTALDGARLEYPEYAHLPVEISAYSFKRAALERAAREILGWKPPEESTTQL